MESCVFTILKFSDEFDFNVQFHFISQRFWKWRFVAKNLRSVLVLNFNCVMLQDKTLLVIFAFIFSFENVTGEECGSSEIRHFSQLDAIKNCTVILGNLAASVFGGFWMFNESKVFYSLFSRLPKNQNIRQKK